ncbi:heme-binding protein [Methylopila henanensis]|uniref:Heme-binding protein n=1 Tax=Methylopila henanensis TaxID=873516 RepID=A0ABW4KA61_9HYPH
MSETPPTRAKLAFTHAAALRALAAAAARADEIGVPHNVSIVDDGGNLLAFVRTDGAKLLSRETSLSKAIAAASHRQPIRRLDPALETRLAIASGGRLTNLAGGLPILFGGECVGGVGVGSGTPEQDVDVARAVLGGAGSRPP